MLQAYDRIVLVRGPLLALVDLNAANELAAARKAARKARRRLEDQRDLGARPARDDETGTESLAPPRGPESRRRRGGRRRAAGTGVAPRGMRRTAAAGTE